MKYDNCKDCVSNCEHSGKDREFVCPGGVSCKVTAPKSKTYSLEEIAVKICDSIPAEECVHCPATLYCRAGHNGMLAWLRKVMEE